MEPSFRQSQIQKMTLSPQMREYLRLLHLPVTELRQAVDAALEENPMLEEAEKGSSPEDAELPQPPEPDGETEDDNPAAVIAGDWEESEPLNFIKSPPDLARRSAVDSRKIHDFQENLLTRPESLFDFLEWQLGFLALPGPEKNIADEIIGNINQDGYLTASLEDIARSANADIGKTEDVLKKVQRFDPPGVAARDLKEALLIQLERRGPEAGLAGGIVRDHLDLVAKRDLKTLSRIYGRSETEIKRAMNVIARLEPKPGRSFYAEEAIAITPDAAISLKEGSDSDLEIRIHDEYIPHVRINREYRNLLRDRHTDAATRDFLKSRLSSGMEFIKALELRRSTLRGITEELVKAQPLFFTRGFSYLRPLRLKDIAERLGLHESTISRAIHGKYMSTPQGTIPYKSFFSQKIDTDDGTGESQKSIMEKLKALIAKEDPRKPLSDQSIVRMLTVDGIRIARRTVAKYRELLKILPTHLRKQR